MGVAGRVAEWTTGGAAGTVAIGGTVAPRLSSVFGLAVPAVGTLEGVGTASTEVCSLAAGLRMRSSGAGGVCLDAAALAAEPGSAPASSFDLKRLTYNGVSVWESAGSVVETWGAPEASGLGGSVMVIRSGKGLPLFMATGGGLQRLDKDALCFRFSQRKVVPAHLDLHRVAEWSKPDDLALRPLGQPQLHQALLEVWLEGKTRNLGAPSHAQFSQRASTHAATGSTKTWAPSFLPSAIRTP